MPDYLVKNIKIWYNIYGLDISYSSDGELRITDGKETLILPSPAYEVYIDAQIRQGKIK